MYYHTSTLSIFFGNKNNKLTAPRSKGTDQEEKLLAQELGVVVNRYIDKKNGLSTPNALPVILLQQMHGTIIHSIDSESDYKKAIGRSLQGDGVIATLPYAAIGILTADCLPIVLYNENPRAIAILHAGWKGITQDIIKKALDQMPNNKLTAFLGPSAQSCCYRVGDEFIRHISSDHQQSLCKRNGDLYFDLHAYAKAELMHYTRASIIAIPACTICSHQFYSHRREGSQSVQRQVTIAMLHKK